MSEEEFRKTDAYHNSFAGRQEDFINKAKALLAHLGFYKLTGRIAAKLSK